VYQTMNGIFRPSSSMPNTYTQIYVQIIFAVRGRRRILSPQIRDEVEKYMTGIIQNRLQKVLAIKAVSDHVHMIIGLNATISISDLVRDIKACSSNFIRERRWFHSQFHWQTGFGAFSYSKSELPNVIRYVLDQERHHQVKTFSEEYLQMLRRAGVDFDMRYVFETSETNTEPGRP